VLSSSSSREECGAARRPLWRRGAWAGAWRGAFRLGLPEGGRGGGGSAAACWNAAGSAAGTGCGLWMMGCAFRRARRPRRPGCCCCSSAATGLIPTNRPRLPKPPLGASSRLVPPLPRCRFSLQLPSVSDTHTDTVPHSLSLHSRAGRCCCGAAGSCRSG
jgi:hypothetical protein